MDIGGQTEFGAIQRILIKHPKDALINQETIDRQYKQLNYFGRPDFEKALAEYERFVELLQSEVSEIEYLPKDDTVGLDSIYARDSSLITNKGSILCNMGKAERQGEPSAVGRYLNSLDVPILGTIEGEAAVEGGDIIWLDEKTLVVGQGYRTNAAGIRRLKELTAGLADDVIVVGLPHWEGSKDVFHLMSFVSPLDRDLAAVYSRLMPVPFRELLLERGMTLVEVPDGEFESMGCNILAIAPRKCIMLEGNPLTQRALEDHGVEVLTYVGDEISRKGAGGPTCLTRPLLRDATV
ncbi:MAG: amidinotransferase [bacterium]|nr:amidinotransferase [bacterium]